MRKYTKMTKHPYLEFMRKEHFLIFLIIPFIFLFVVLLLKDAQGPYWLGSNSDPEYAYLLNSLNLAEGQPVGHVDHPGTPLQEAGAVVLKVFHSFRNAGTLSEDVLKNPEAYLLIMNGILLALGVCLLFFIGWFAFRKTGDMRFSLLIQASPFFSTALLLSAARMNPEPLLLVISFAMIPAILFFRESFFIFSFLCGLGVAAKVTFLPMVLVPLFVLPGIFRKISFAVLMAAFVFWFTSPIISEYGFILKLFRSLFMHTQIYGGGPEKIVDPRLYLANLKHLHQTEPVFFAVFYLSLFAWIRRKKKDFWLLSGILACQSSSILMVAKHFMAGKEYYLLPALMLSALSLYLFWEITSSRQDPRALFFSSLIGLFFIVRIFDLTHTYFDLRKTKDEQLRVYRKVQEYPDHAKVYYYRSSSPYYALKFGDDFSLGRHADVLNKLYPRVYFYNIWSSRYSGWNEWTNLGRIRNESGDRVIFQGSSFDKAYKIYPQYRPIAVLTDILGGDYETAYKLE